MNLLRSLCLASLLGTGVLCASPVEPSRAPDWTLKDLNGNSVSFAQFKGKVVVVDFWATWCGPCRSEIPGYVDLQKKYAADGLVIVGVSLDQSGPEAVRNFVQKYGVSYTIVLGNDEAVAAFGGVDAIPTTFIIDRQGMIRDRKIGAEDTATFEKALLPFLKPAG